MTSKRYWEMLDDPNPRYEPLADLVNWSANYEQNQPYRKFLDLIGYSEENYGETIGNWEKVTQGLDFSSLDYIAKALILYSEAPSSVNKWINQLEEASAE